MQKPGISGVEIDDSDKNGFMATIHGLKRQQGLDLLLHTPGGQVAATESIVDYLRTMFDGDIRAVIPQLALSAGTLMACACRKILMGKQSSLGPIDPQFGGIPAFGVLEEFERAIREVKEDPAKAPIWRTIIGKYHPTFIGECENAIRWSAKIARDWLITGMLKHQPDGPAKAQTIVSALQDRAQLLTHARHLSLDECEKLGLTIEKLETDQTLQDLALTVHHAFMHTFGSSTAIKIIENHRGVASVFHAQVARK